MHYGKNGSTEHSKGNKTVPGKVATTPIEDGHKSGKSVPLQARGARRVPGS